MDRRHTDVVFTLTVGASAHWHLFCLGADVADALSSGTVSATHNVDIGHEVTKINKMELK